MATARSWTSRKTRASAHARSTRAAAWGDFDEDGDPDLLVGFTPGAAGSVLRLYRNTKGKFADVTTQHGLGVGTGAVRQPVWFDFDAHGDLDLFVAFRDRANALFLNDLLRGGSGTFRDVAARRGPGRHAKKRGRRLVRLRSGSRSRLMFSFALATGANRAV
jgi:hypothetical protein